MTAFARPSWKVLIFKRFHPYFGSLCSFFSTLKRFSLRSKTAQIWPSLFQFISCQTNILLRCLRVRKTWQLWCAFKTNFLFGNKSTAKKWMSSFREKLRLSFSIKNNFSRTGPLIYKQCFSLIQNGPSYWMFWCQVFHLLSELTETRYLAFLSRNANQSIRVFWSSYDDDDLKSLTFIWHLQTRKKLFFSHHKIDLLIMA